MINYSDHLGALINSNKSFSHTYLQPRQLKEIQNSLRARDQLHFVLPSMIKSSVFWHGAPSPRDYDH